MIPEPQRTYLLELLKALGPAADDFVIVGAQALKFLLPTARGTKDVDFILDVVQLRNQNAAVAGRLQALGYSAVEGARNFQFEKEVPGSAEKMRIEFMAPEDLRRKNDFRVDVDENVHARACKGGNIALAESASYQLSGHLPDGSPFTAAVRVTKPHALVMLKLLALDDRYRNIRGPREAAHDREEALVHAADIVAVVSAQVAKAQFRKDFENQFRNDQDLGKRATDTWIEYFKESTSPGLLLYEEFLAREPSYQNAQRELREEVERAHNMMSSLLA